MDVCIPLSTEIRSNNGWESTPPTSLSYAKPNRDHLMWPLRKGVESGKCSNGLSMTVLPFGVESCMPQRRGNFARWVKVKLSGICSEGHCVHRCTRNTGEVRPRQQRPRLSGASMTRWPQGWAYTSIYASPTTGWSSFLLILTILLKKSEGNWQ